MSIYRIVPVALLLLLSAGSMNSLRAQEKVTFDDHIKPLFRQRCAACHSTSKKSGDLDVTSYLGVMQGGGSGAVVTPGDVSASYLFALVNHDEEPYMPPDSPPIPAEEIALLRAWIDQGLLENQNSKARVPSGPRIAAVEGSATERPATVVVPGHLSIEPVRVVARPNSVVTSHTHPWAPLVATAAAEQVLLHDSNDGSLKGVLAFPEGTINVVRFSRNGALLIAAGGRPGAQGIVAIWDTATGERVATLDEEADAILAADISADHRFVAVGGTNRLVRIYRISDDKLIHEIKKHTEWVTAIEFSPDGILVASGDRNGGCFVWETRTAREYLTLAGHPQSVNGLSWRWDSNLLASASLDGTVKLWELENGGQVRNWNAHGGGVQSIEFTRDGRIVTAGRDRTAKLWDQAGSQLAAFGGLTDIATAASFCDETGRMFVGDWAGAFVAVGADGAEITRLEVNPAHLEQRLVAATSQADPLVAAYQPEAAKLTALQGTLAEAQTRLTSYQTKMTELEADLATRNANLKSWTDSAAALTQSRTNNTAVMQQLAVVLEKSAAVEASMVALGQSIEDAKVAELQAAFVAWKTAKNTELEAIKVKLVEEEKQLAALQTMIDAETPVIAAKTKEAADLAPMIATTNTEVTDMTAAVAALEPQVAALKGTADVAVAAVERWKSELAFVSQLNAIDVAHQELQQRIEATYTEMDPLNEQLATATGQREAAIMEAEAAKVVEAERKTAMDGMVAAMAAMQETRNTTNAKLVAETTERDGTSNGLVALGEALVGTRRAIELMPGDAELAEALKRLEALEVAKKEKVTQLETSMAALTTEIAGYDAKMQELSAAMTALAPELEKASADVVAKVAASTSFDASIAQLSTSVGELQAKIDAMQVEVEANRKARAALQGLAS